jgi:hypothetical protein
MVISVCAEFLVADIRNLQQGNYDFLPSGLGSSESRKSLKQQGDPSRVISLIFPLLAFHGQPKVIPAYTGPRVRGKISLFPFFP